MANAIRTERALINGSAALLVIEDCVGGSSVEAHAASLRAMKYLQTDASRRLDEVPAAMQGA